MNSDLKMVHSIKTKLISGTPYDKYGVKFPKKKLTVLFKQISYY